MKCIFESFPDKPHILSDMYAIKKIFVSFDKVYKVKVHFDSKYRMPSYQAAFPAHKRGFLAQLLGKYLPLYMASLLKRLSPETLYTYLADHPTSPYFFVKELVMDDISCSAKLYYFEEGNDYWVNIGKTPLHYIGGKLCNAKSNPNFMDDIEKILHEDMNKLERADVSLHPNGSSKLICKNVSMVKEKDTWRKTTGKNAIIKRLLAQKSGLTCPPKDYLGRLKHVPHTSNNSFDVRRCIAVEPTHSVWQYDTYYEKVKSFFDKKYNHIETQLYVHTWDANESVGYEKILSESVYNLPKTIVSLEAPKIVHRNEVEIVHHSNNCVSVSSPGDQILVKEMEEYRVDDTTTVVVFMLQNNYTCIEYPETYALPLGDRVVLLSEEDALVKKVLTLRLLKDALTY